MVRRGEPLVPVEYEAVQVGLTEPLPILLHVHE